MTAPKLRFKEFDGDWSSIAIGNLLKIKSGLGFKAEEYTTEEAIRLLQIENVGYGAVKWTHNVKYVPHDYLSIHPELVLKEDDIVLALNRPVTNDQLKIAKLTKDDGPSILYQRVGKLEFKKNEIDHNFIFQIFQKEVKSYVLNSSIGSDQPFISTTDLYKHKITLPAQKEQTKIASFLSAVDEKISQLTQKHQLLSQYKQGMMQKLFSQQIRFKADDGSEFGEWEENTIQYFLDQNYIIDQMDGNHGELYPKSEEFSDLGIPYIGATDFSNGTVCFATCKRLPLERALKFKKGIAKDGDVLFAHNATVGPVAILKTSFEFVILSTTATYYRCNSNKLINTYLKNILASDYFKKQYTGIMSQSTRNQVPITTQRKLKLVLPCLEEQSKIAYFLSAIDQKIEVVAQQIEQAKTWKKGLLQQMFV